jgi:hypothetical protein
VCVCVYSHVCIYLYIYIIERERERERERRKWSLFVWSLVCNFFDFLVKMFITILSLVNRDPKDIQIH